MSIFEKRIIDLTGLQNYEFIQFLRVEILDVQGYGPAFFGQVRYALNGVEQDESLPMDLGKGIFIATLRDDQLGDIPRETLEKTLQEAAVKIIEIVRKNPNIQTPLPDYDYLMYDKDCSEEKVDKTTVTALENILKDYPYLKYDELYSKPPDVLKCRVTVNRPRRADDIFEIEHRLRDDTGEKYIVTYGGSSGPGDNLDEVWSTFSLRKFDFQPTKSK
ncbi:hypothetical protein C6496_10960 [Candidatus Poribacteria bacterium]|nr:MAG: hypothetical protein C6496_10960 [Candidatus Poribacteria bacterium]